MILNELLQRFSEDTLILTPNRRLTAYLIEQFNREQLASQKVAWPSLSILPLNQWLTQLWHSAQTEYTLLDSAQLDYVWHQIILQHSTSFELLKMDATVQHAIDAFRSLMLWQVPILMQDFSIESDWGQFYQWFNAYQSYCQQHNYIDEYQLPHQLLELIKQNKILKQSPKKIFLLGFDEIPPLWQFFLNSLKDFSSIEIADLTTTNKSKQRLEFQNFNTELAAMIDWVKKQYETNSSATIACIVPSLATQRAMIEKAFIKAFAPEKFLQLDDKADLPFNISAGQPLSKFPIIAAALKILTLKCDHLAMSTIKFLLRSSFIIGYYEEYANRAALEIIINNLQVYTVSHEHFLNLLQQHCPILAEHYQKFSAIAAPEQNSLLQWMEFYNAKLAAVGWPGARELSSQNYQLVMRLKNLFNEMLTFDLLFYHCSSKTAIELLLKRCNTTLFQIKTLPKKIQILGSLEGAGMLFDKIWIMELNDKQWPAAANPNPFIPHKLQNYYQLPHANAERELQFSKTLLQRYFNSAPEVYLSYAKENNGQDYHCSPLIADIALSKQNFILNELADKLFKGNKLDYFYDNEAPVVSDIEMTTLKGGANILTLQSACPFRAFATYRLEIKPSLLPQPGLTALERGKIIHAALEIFWQRVKTHYQLCQLTEKSLHDTITAAANAAILSINFMDYAFSPKFYKLETQRVVKLLSYWLELEKQRDAFEVIATEHAIETNFAALPLKLRIDRIDQLANGALILLDYKTNIISINRWFEERIDDPQLPLYALIFPNEISGILFGQIKLNEMAIKGIGHPEAYGFGIKNITAETSITWEAQKQQWQTNLEKLAQDFMSGKAAVDPKNAQSCNFCDLKRVCRIGERNESIE